jgi:hypothetical protein
MTPQDPIYSLPTNVGAAKLAYAMANQLTVDISHMAIGDGNGVAVNPTAAWPALAREVHRAQLNQLYQHPDNPNWLVAELVLPAEVGGWTIREIALYDVDGDLIFIGNHAEQYKPVQSQGSDETKTIRMVILVSSTSAVTLKTDPTTVMATVDYVQRELAKLDHKQSVRYATTADVVLSGLGVQAGGDWAAALTAGDRVLVKSQAAAKDNGIYVVAGGAWVRSTDADISAEVTSGLVVAVEQGAFLADTRWQLVTDGAIVLGTTALTFQDVTKGYAPLSSPAFTDNPTAPTPAQFNSSDSIATTEFATLLGLCARGGLGISIAENISLTLAQSGGWCEFNADNSTVTLPALATTAQGLTAYTFRANGRKGCVIKANGAEAIHAPGGSIVNTYQLSSHESAMIVSNGPAGDWYIILGGVGGGAFGSSLTSNGYKRIADPNSPTGFFIEQWVTGASDVNSNMALTLPIQFPNAILGGIANEASPVGWLANSVSVWGFDLAASSTSIVVARVRNIIGTGGPAMASGISGRIRVWGY